MSECHERRHGSTDCCQQSHHAPGNWPSALRLRDRFYRTSAASFLAASSAPVARFSSAFAAQPRSCLHVALTVERKLDDYLKQSSLIRGIIFPGSLVAGSSVPVAQVVCHLQVGEDGWAAVIAWDGIMIRYRGQGMGPFQVRVDRKTAAMARPPVALAYLHPDSLASVVARADVTAFRADETACLLVAVLAPVHLYAAPQAAHSFIERVRPNFPERRAELKIGIIDSPLRDATLATCPGVIRPRVHDSQRTHIE
jgi:hypothetical protein